MLLTTSKAFWISLLSFNAVNGVRAVCGPVIIGIILFLAWRDGGRTASFASYATPALGALVVFSPTVMPWYVIWVLPMVVIVQNREWFHFSALVCAAFLVMIDEIEHTWALWLESGLFALFVRD